MKICLLLSLLGVALVGVGCHSGHSLVGKWTTNLNGTTQAVEFSADSKMSATVEQQGLLPTTTTVSGTYTLDKDAFSVKVTDIQVKAHDTSKQSLVDSYMSGQKQKTLDGINSAGSNTKLTWKSDDEVVVTNPAGKQQIFTRVKS